MASAIYRKFKKKILTKTIDVTTDTIKAVLVTASYVFSQTHEFLSDVGANTIGTAITATGVTADQPNDGTLDCNDLTFTAVPSGTAVAIVFYKDTGSSATSPLIYYDDSITGFPLSTTGGDVTVTIDSGTNRLFTL